MKNTNLEALNALIERIRVGEGTAESNLEALNMLCVLSGGTGKAKSNLEALNELLNVFEAAKPEQVKSVAITENGTTKVSPDDGYVLSSVDVDVNVPSKPEQTKAVTITENGTTEITPDEGYTLSGASVSVEVKQDNNIKLSILNRPSNSQYPCTDFVEKINMSDVVLPDPNLASLNYLFTGLEKLKEVIWGRFPQQMTAGEISFERMFFNDKSLESIDFSPFGIRIIKSALYLFSGCNSLKNIIWGDVKVHFTSLSNMFKNCKSIETIDTSFLDHDWTNFRIILEMFSGCGRLKNIDLSNLNTLNITDTYHVFMNCNSLESVIFENNCFLNESLTTLDLEGAPLTHDCAVDIFNKLATRTNSPTIKLSTTTKGYLTDDEIAIVTGKGWVIP